MRLGERLDIARKEMVLVDFCARRVDEVDAAVVLGVQRDVPVERPAFHLEFYGALPVPEAGPAVPRLDEVGEVAGFVADVAPDALAECSLGQQPLGQCIGADAFFGCQAVAFEDAEHLGHEHAP